MVVIAAETASRLTTEVTCIEFSGVVQSLL
jgi:hypothetical protein